MHMYQDLQQISICFDQWRSCIAGRVRGLKGHRWLIAACETKILMIDLVSRASREVPRAVMDGRAPTSLAFLYKCSPLLLGATVKHHSIILAEY